MGVMDNNSGDNDTGEMRWSWYESGIKRQIKTLLKVLAVQVPK